MSSSSTSTPNFPFAISNSALNFSPIVSCSDACTITSTSGQSCGSNVQSNRESSEARLTIVGMRMLRDTFGIYAQTSIRLPLTSSRDASQQSQSHHQQTSDDSLRVRRDQAHPNSRPLFQRSYAESECALHGHRA